MTRTSASVSARAVVQFPPLRGRSTLSSVSALAMNMGL